MSTTQEVKALKKDIAQLKNMLADQLDEATPNGQSRSIFSKEELSHAAHNAGQNVRHFLENKQEQFAYGKEKCQSTIKARPLTSAAVLLAGGMLLGSILKRK